MTAAPPTVRELRRRWKPHKERLGRLQSDHPSAVRFHRACSWLQQAEGLQAAEQPDFVLLCQWIALNALYGQWDPDRAEPVPDRGSWQAFVGRMLELDSSGHLVSLLQEHKRLVLSIIEDAYLNRHYWQDPTPRSANRARNGRHQAQAWYVERRWRVVIEGVLDRVYLLRCQLTHGAATHGSRLNRTALKRCVTMMSLLLPAFLQVWIEHGADEDWGPMCYPPLGRSTSPGWNGRR